jgi:hypothetical protein
MKIGIKEILKDRKERWKKEQMKQSNKEEKRG